MADRLRKSSNWSIVTDAPMEREVGVNEMEWNSGTERVDRNVNAGSGSVEGLD